MNGGVLMLPFFQGEVCNMINKKYNEFLPSMQSAEDLVSQLEGLSSNIDVLKAGIENEVTACPASAALAHFTRFQPRALGPSPSWGVARGPVEEDSS